MTLSPERLTEMRIENDAILRRLYEDRARINGEIEFRERLKKEWASPSDRADAGAGA